MISQKVQRSHCNTCDWDGWISPCVCVQLCMQWCKRTCACTCMHACAFCTLRRISHYSLSTTYWPYQFTMWLITSFHVLSPHFKLSGPLLFCLTSFYRQCSLGVCTLLLWEVCSLQWASYLYLRITLTPQCFPCHSEISSSTFYGITAHSIMNQQSQL